METVAVDHSVQSLQRDTICKKKRRGIVASETAVLSSHHVRTRLKAVSVTCCCCSATSTTLIDSYRECREHTVLHFAYRVVSTTLIDSYRVLVRTHFSVCLFSIALQQCTHCCIEAAIALVEAISSNSELMCSATAAVPCAAACAHW
jgi:hypothetical protein